MKIISSFLVAGNLNVLTLDITTSTQPHTETVNISAENNLLSLLKSKEVLQSVAQTLSEQFEAHVKLTDVRKGSIKVDMVLEDLSGLEYIKEMSDKWALTNIVDNILMTQEFIESCQAEDVIIEVVVDEVSYQQLKSHCGEYNNDNKDNLLVKMYVVQGISGYLSFIIS